MKSRNAVIAALAIQIMTNPVVLQRLEAAIRPDVSTLPFGAPAPKSSSRVRSARLAVANLIQDLRP
jgi:hypothetical protein